MIHSERRTSTPSQQAGHTPACDANSRLRLPPGQIDVWVTPVDEVPEADLAAQFDQVLIDDERRQHDRFVFEKDRRRYRVTRSIVRYVLSRYAPIAPADWRFTPTVHGRPLIANRHAAADDLVFNISHSDRVVMVGVAWACQLGLDVEDLNRNVPIDMVDRFFSAGEVRQLRALPPALQPRCFLDIWTLKESYIKARGKGLSLPLSKFGFAWGDEPRLQAHFDAELNDSACNWTFWQWCPGGGSVAALCVENQPGIDKVVTVRRAIPFVHEAPMAFEVLRVSSP
jgi:4'-phosphopantetheinyl transferase